LHPPDGGRSDSTLPGGDTGDSYRASGDSSAIPGIIPTVSVSVSDEVCALRTDGTIDCWGNIRYPVPAGTFISVSAGDGYACAVKPDGTIFCWGGDAFGDTLPPPGTFTSVSTGWDFACGLRTDETIACWGNSAYGDTAPPAGTFKSISLASKTDGYDCGVRTDGTLACWGNNAIGNTGLPTGTFTSVSVGGGGCPCGVRTDGTLARCKVEVPPGGGYIGCPTLPLTGPFLMVSGDYGQYLLKTDGTIVMFCSNPQSPPPSDRFISISVGSNIACGVKVDGTVYCWWIS
jgi:hypothetical protein